LVDLDRQDFGHLELTEDQAEVESDEYDEEDL
jgi:hypothetical protein